jgi:hypothetical protein
MPDWRHQVYARLLGLALPPNEKEDVVAELADHLEEGYVQLRAQGFSSEDAVKQSLEQVSDWNAFTKRIQAAKKGDIMNDRIRIFWLPGILTLTLSMGFLLILQVFGFQPRTVSWGHNGLVLFYIPWLLSLPVFGALGAYLSSRAGGSRQAVLLSSVFPAVYPTICFFVILPLALLFNRTVAQHFHLPSIFPQIFAWLVVPATALLIGGLGLLAISSRRLNTR